MLGSKLEWETYLFLLGNSLLSITEANLFEFFTPLGPTYSTGLAWFFFLTYLVFPNLALFFLEPIILEISQSAEWEMGTLTKFSSCTRDWVFSLASAKFSICLSTDFGVDSANLGVLCTLIPSLIPSALPRKEHSQQWCYNAILLYFSSLNTKSLLQQWS